jgi:hypothetical protein
MFPLFLLACLPVALWAARKARIRAERDRWVCERVGRMVRQFQDRELARDGGGV